MGMNKSYPPPKKIETLGHPKLNLQNNFKPNSTRVVHGKKAKVPPSSERSAVYHHDVLPRSQTKR